MRQTAPITLAVVIVHDRRRAELAGRLLADMQAQAAALNQGGTILCVGVSICDAGSGLSPWAGMRAALTGACLGDYREQWQGVPTHVLLLEDDAVAAPGSLRACLKAVQSRPMDVLHLAGTEDQVGPAVREAVGRGGAKERVYDWAFVFDRCVGSLAVAMPLATARRFLNWATRPGFDEWFANEQPLSPHDGDARLAQYLIDVVGVAQVVSCYALFGHGQPEPGQSLVERSMIKPTRPRPVFRPVDGVAAAHGVAMEGDPVRPPQAAWMGFNRGSGVDARCGYSGPRFFFNRHQEGPEGPSRVEQKPGEATT